MKRKISVSLLIKFAFLFLAGTLSGCDFLDEQPYSFVGPENAFITADEAIAGVNHAYDGLRRGGYYASMFWRLGDVAADQSRANNNQAIEFDNFDYDASTQALQELWSGIYDAVNRANSVLTNVPSINMNAEFKQRIIAEASFLRALNYFNLVRIWGDVPLTLSETRSLANLNVPRNTMEEVYSQIIADLQIAEEGLPQVYPASDKGRATQGAARTLLAKVYLTLAGNNPSSPYWTLARDKAQEVISAGTYSLFPDYADVWLIPNKNDREHIFMVQYRGAAPGRTDNVVGDGSPFFTLFAPSNQVAAGGSSASSFPEPSFVGSFEDNPRKDATFITSWTLANGNIINFPHHIAKYLDPGAPSTNASNNYPILRYPDLLLIYAEAENEISGPGASALESVNQVRRRAWGVSVTDPSAFDLPSDITRDELRVAIHQERSWELCFESDRWFDLVRTGQMIPVMQASGKAVGNRHVLFPVPQREIDFNPLLTQNPGY